MLYLGQFRTITNLFLKSSSSKCRSTSTTARWIHATPVILVYEKELAMFSFAARFPAILQVHGDFLCNQVIMITRFLFIFYYHCVHNICKKYIWHHYLTLITLITRTRLHDTKIDITWMITGRCMNIFYDDTNNPTKN